LISWEFPGSLSLEEEDGFLEGLGIVQCRNRGRGENIGEYQKQAQHSDAHLLYSE